MQAIFRTTLRTLDVEAAEKFYASVLGSVPVGVVRLHEQAIARGARPHWLGFVDVADVDRAAAAFVERGANLLGPKWTNPEGMEAAVMRDPGGALIALAKRPPNGLRSAAPEVVFHALNTPDVARAMKNYGELFGWQFDEPIDFASYGSFHPFRWQAGGPVVGVFGDIGARPTVHPHWTFHYRVEALDAAIARVAAARGVTLGPLQLPSGDRFAVCDDPQGAAFALYEAQSPA